MQTEEEKQLFESEDGEQFLCKKVYRIQEVDTGILDEKRQSITKTEKFLLTETKFEAIDDTWKIIAEGDEAEALFTKNQGDMLLTLMGVDPKGVDTNKKWINPKRVSRARR